MEQAAIYVQVLQWHGLLICDSGEVLFLPRPWATNVQRWKVFIWTFGSTSVS